MQEIDAFRKNAESYIASNNKSIEEFKLRISGLKSDAKEGYDNKIIELNKMNVDLKMKMDDFKFETQSNWETFKSELNHTMEYIGTQLKNFKIKDGQ